MSDRREEVEERGELEVVIARFPCSLYAQCEFHRIRCSTFSF